VTTLIGLNYKDYQVDNMRLYKEIVSQTLWEGVETLKAAGYHEFNIGDMPSWNLLKLSKTLPYFVAKGMFKKKIKKMVLSSMAQDVLINKRKTNELEDINGVLINLANRYNVKIPFNKAIYRICKEKFEEPEKFIPMKLSEIWQEIEKERNKEL
jgi:ketopantoate reductase